jgi:hypothetical protein
LSESGDALFSASAEFAIVVSLVASSDVLLKKKREKKGQRSSLNKETRERATHLHSIHQQGGDESVDVLLGRRLSSSLNLVDHLLHREGEERDGRLEHVENVLDALPGLRKRQRKVGLSGRGVGRIGSRSVGGGFGFDVRIGVGLGAGGRIDALAARLLGEMSLVLTLDDGEVLLRRSELVEKTLKESEKRKKRSAKRYQPSPEARSEDEPEDTTLRSC